LIKIISEYLKVDERWVPEGNGFSLYLRPTMIGTQEMLGVNPPTDAKLFVIGCPVGPYYKTGFNAVRLLATTEYVRAWPRGTGAAKIGGNYAPGKTFSHSKKKCNFSLTPFNRSLASAFGCC
jgi:branched-chain amino acid aminotransferase